MKYTLIGILIFLSFASKAQDYPRDTSYTVYSAFQKSVKRFPSIKTVLPEKNEKVRISRNLPYKQTENRTLVLDVYEVIEKEKKASPAVLMIHGGGWLTGDKSHMEPMAIQLALRGYVAVAVEYRLSPEAKYPAAVLDIKDAIRWIKKESITYRVDTSKIAILGTSAGGQLANLVGFTNGNPKFEEWRSSSNFSSDVHAIINMDGVLAFHHPDSKEGRVAGLWLGGSYEEAGDRWEEASAINHIDKNDPPILFIHSQYPRFHAGRDDAIVKLDSLGIYSEVQGFDDCPHTFWLFDPWFEPTMVYVLDFLEKIFNR